MREKGETGSGDFSSMSFASQEFNTPWGQAEKPQQSLLRRTLESFKRDPSIKIMSKASGADGRVFDAEAAAQSTAVSPLVRRLKGRHLQMIAFGGSIGTGLFVGSGKALANGGPASVLISFCLTGIMLYCTMHALGEMAVTFPVAGSFSAYSTRFLDPAWGFAMGWNYAIQWLTVLPLEIVAASITIGWFETGINNAVWVTIFLVLIVVINLFGVRGYGEAEFVFSIIKIIAVIGFIILGVILNIGGGKDGSYIGGMYWHDPGAFHNGFKGLCSCFVTAAFAFTGTELVGLAAAETANPRKTIPTATKQVFWRICIFYVVSLTIVGLLVPWNEPRLITTDSPEEYEKNSSHNTKTSPFVIAISNAGIQGLDAVMNVVIMLAVISVGNSAVYGSSRTIAALAEQRQAPRIFAYIDRQGRPLVAILSAALIGLLAYLAATPKQEDVFTWLLAMSGLSSIFTWASICLAHIRFRKAWKIQGRSLDDLAFRSQPGIIGSYVGFLFNILVLAAQFWTGFAPVGWETNTARENTSSFFESYLAVPIVLAFYIPYKIWYRTPYIKYQDMDLTTGMRELNLAELLAEERKEQASWPKWKRWYKFCC